MFSTFKSPKSNYQGLFSRILEENTELHRRLHIALDEIESWKAVRYCFRLVLFHIIVPMLCADPP
jgi:hypothetical protein